MKPVVEQKAAETYEGLKVLGRSNSMGTNDHIFTLGIEEEFQIIDPETRELRSHIQHIPADGKMILQGFVKPELHQSTRLGAKNSQQITIAAELGGSPMG
jgi:hypothetical protein